MTRQKLVSGIIGVKGRHGNVILTVKLPSRRPGHDDIKEKFEDNIPEDIQVYRE